MVPLARCSHHFRQLALPLIWDDVTARLSWVATRRVCMVARRPHIAPLVHRFDVGRQRDSQWHDDIDVLPTLAATLSRLSNLRRLSFAVGDRLDCGSLDGCYFPHLEALSMPFTRGNVSFVKRHPGITSLFSPRPYTFELFKAMGTGKPLQAFSGDLNLMLEVLGTQRSLNQSSRLLDSGCYIRPIWPCDQYCAQWCETVARASIRIGCLCLYVHRLEWLPNTCRVSKRVTNVDTLRLTSQCGIMRPAAICALLSVFDGLRALEFDCRAETVLGNETDIHRRDFEKALKRFTDACDALETVRSPWGTKWQKQRGLWVEGGACTLRPFEPFG